MTREEYINFANALKNNYTIDFDKLPEFCDMAISLSENDVLDKIRTEIEKPLRVERCFDTANAKAQYIALNWCIEIIDKYKAESEE